MPDDDYTPRRLEYRATSTSPAERYPTPSAGLIEDDPRKAIRSDLDSPRVQNIHRRMLAHYHRELEAQSASRRQMEKDEAYYDHDQWEPEDIALLQRRGQEPLVMNVIAQSVNWVLGTERRSRTDFKILPRRKEGSKAAERKSQLIKYLSDTNMTAFHTSRAFADAAKVGLGWLECGVQDDTEGEPIYERYESWRNIIFDSLAQEMDLSDARYMFRTKWVDTDTALAMFPDRAMTVRMAASSVYDFGSVIEGDGDDAMDSQETAAEGHAYRASMEHPASQRSRVRLIEAWFKVPEEEERISGGDFTGEIFDPASPGHMAEIESGAARLTKKITFRTYVMICTANGALWLSKSPYRHNRYPFTPIWGYRKASDGTPYGMIRGMRDMQRDINKRFSKALAIISSNKTIMDKGAVDDLDEFHEEVSRPDAIIVKNPGKELKIDAERELADAHLQLMQMGIGMIQTLSGITDEALGRTTNASSGKAIIARQEQGAMATATVFDNLRLARHHHGTKLVSLIEQFMTDAKAFRITNQRGMPDWVTVNDGLPENDIVRFKADYVISEEDWNSTLRQAQVQELLSVLQQLAPVAPQIVLMLLDLLVEAMDIPSREEIVKRIRQQTGMEDPDADPNVPDPEREAREAAKAAQAEMEQRAAQAELAKLEGQAAEVQAKAQKIALEAQKALKAMPSDDIATQRAALELAIQMLSAEPAVNTADAVLQQAGYQPGAQQGGQPIA